MNPWKRVSVVCLSLALAVWLSPAHGQGVSISGPAGTYTSTVTLVAAGPVTISSPWSGPAGVYTFTLPAGATVTQTATSITITWGAPGPTPVPPTPTPTMPDGSQPINGLFVALVTDPSVTPSAAIQALKTSTTIGPVLKAKNATWMVADTSTISLAAWMTDVKAAGLPALLVIATDASNKSVAHEIIKAVDETSTVAEISRIRGTK